MSLRPNLRFLWQRFKIPLRCWGEGAHVVMQGSNLSVLWAGLEHQTLHHYRGKIWLLNSESGDLIQSRATISNMLNNDYCGNCKSSFPKITSLTRLGARGSVRDREQPCTTIDLGQFKSKPSCLAGAKRRCRLPAWCLA
jgi:hypothetical protein